MKAQQEKLDIDRVEFDMAFNEDTELTGYMWLRLWVPAEWL